MHPILLNSVAPLARMLTLGAGDTGSLMLPPEGSDHAGQVDPLFNFINGVTVFFFVLIIVIMVFFALKYRRTPTRTKADVSSNHNTGLELAWSLPPLVICIYIFYAGFTGYLDIVTVPDNAYQINVHAQKWKWSFEYPNGYTSGYLHVPAGRPVVLRLSSIDVLHSMYIPDFRVKKDVVPGRYNTLWFQTEGATESADAPLLVGDALNAYIRGELTKEVEGQRANNADASGGKSVQDEVEAKFAKLKPNQFEEYARHQQEEIAAKTGRQIFCAEYCGTDHSMMLSKVIVHEKGWLPPRPIKGTPWQEGRKTFMANCTGCHKLTEDGLVRSVAAPDFSKGIFGKDEKMSDGSTVKIDEAYIHESIADPQAKIVAGYPKPSPMPAFGFAPSQIDELVSFLKSPFNEPE
ncbi:MAG: c-type cytochrome [Planctomycetes bacterium]|nr:c-type cytochrome [Planctomycetota bacterium]